MFVGQNGKVTSNPNSSGEKVCVACEHWVGAREVTYNGFAATSFSDSAAMCRLKHSNVYPGQPCSCPTISFQKWSMLK